MANYSWDLGFDLGAVQQTGQSYLETGFVALLTTGHVVTAPVNLQVGDIISFNAFNVSNSLISGAADWSISDGVITFSNGEIGQTTTSPFEDQSLFISGMSAQGSGASTVFSGGAETVFPVFPNAAASQTIVNAGKYLMTVTLNVQSGSEQRTFVVDPEMVVGSVG